jgi:hypothetical protein
MTSLFTGLRQKSAVCLALLIAVLASLPCSDLAARNSLVGDPTFKEASLPTEARIWYQRVIANANYRPTSFKGAPNTPDAFARSGDPYYIGRALNVHVTLLLLNFRQTGDMRLLDEVTRLMDITKSKLWDAWDNGTKDGFLNWRNNRDKLPLSIRGKDIERDLDEILYSALVAEVAYVYHLNRGKPSPKGYDYATRADFWKNYMVNHYEKKWRKREGKPTGFPYIRAFLMHIHANQIRCYYYLYKITGNTSYLGEARRLASLFDKNMVTVQTKAGAAYVWSQSVHFMGGLKDLGGIPNGQPTVYCLLTYTAILDLHMEGFEQFGKDAEMRKYMIPLRDFVLDGKSTSLPLARGIVGDYGVVRTGIRKGDGKTVSIKPFAPSDPNPSKYGREDIIMWGRGVLGMLAPWDDTSKLQQFTVKSYNVTNKNYLEKPRLSGAVNAVFFTIMKQRDGTNATPPPTAVEEAPAAPSSLAVEVVSSTSLRLTWTDNSANEDGFRIQQSLDGTTWALVASVGSGTQAYLQTGLKSATRYYFRVQAYNEAGVSVYSNKASATTQAAATVPARPLNLSAAAISPTEIKLTWSDQSANETGFKIERSLDGGITFAQIRTTGSNVTTATINNLTPLKRYHFRVRAYNGIGNSAYSNVDDATTPDVPNSLPMVSLTNPSAAASLKLGESLILQATAGDSDGSIVRVAFYAGSTWLGADTTAPYTFDWKPTAIGAYSITAKAIDDRGGSSVSTAHTVTVNDVVVPKALFVTDNATLKTSDQLIVDRLTSLGVDVEVKTDAVVAATDTAGKQLVLISSNVNSGALGSRLRDIQVAVICWEPYLYDDMGMTGTVAETDYHWLDGQTSIGIHGTSSPLAAGVYGEQAVYTSSQSVAWGTPSSGAHVVATLKVNSKPCVFTYNAGRSMVGLTAPAKRVGLFLGNDGPTVLTSLGWKIFDEAVKWSLVE